MFVCVYVRVCVYSLYMGRAAGRRVSHLQWHTEQQQQQREDLCAVLGLGF